MHIKGKSYYAFTIFVQISKLMFDFHKYVINLGLKFGFTMRQHSFTYGLSHFPG